MSFHPAHPLFVLLESVDLDNEEQILNFAKENQKFQKYIQNDLLRNHINRVRVKQGKEEKEILEIGADDAVPFRISLVVDYLSKIPPEQAEGYYQKILEISEKMQNILSKAPEGIRNGVTIYGEEHIFMTSIESAFEAAKTYDFKVPTLKELEEPIATINDPEISVFKQSAFQEIASLDPENKIAVLDFFQKLEAELFAAKQLALGSAMTGLDEQIPLLIAFSMDIAVRENISQEKMQAILDKLMVLSDALLETVRTLPDGKLQDELNVQYAWCFNLTAALTHCIQNNVAETLCDPQSLEYFSKLHEDKFKVLLQVNTSIWETQRKLDKEKDPEKRQSYKNEIDSNISLFKALIKENPELLQKQDAADHNILYYVAKESPNPIIVEFLINNGCDIAKMGVTKNDIEADYLVDRKGNPVQFIGYDGEERDMTLNERLLQLKNSPAFDGYRIQRVLPKIQAFIDSNDVDGLRALFSTRECSGINPNHAVNAKGDTLMHLVCRANNPEMIHFFLTHEFDNGREVKFNIKNEDGNYSFELMADTASTQSLKQGMKHIYEQEFLVKCIKEKSLDEFAVELQRAMDNGFELNGKYSAKGENLLHLCVQASNTIGEEKFKALLEHLHAKGADFNAKDKAGETPLFKAAQTPSFSFEAFKLMIDQYQADPDVLSLKNRSILISALITGRSNSAISDYMLNRFEQTGKLYTTESGEKIRYLSLPDQDGLTAMHYALDQNNTQLIDKLLEQDFDLTLDLEDWINYEGRKKSDRIGYSVLHLAAEKCSPEFFEKILNKYKEQLQVQFIRENLHLSVDARDQQFEELFKERINELDGQIGFTLLHAALNNHNNKDIIEILKKNGASLTEENTATGQSYSARAMIPFGKAIVSDQPFDVSSKLISPEMLSMHFSNNGRTPLMMVLDSLIGKTNVQVKDTGKKSDGQEKQTKNNFVLGKASNIEVNSQLLAHIMQMSEDSAVYKQVDATGNTPLHYAMRILATTLTDKQRKPVLEMISKCLNAGVGLDNQNVDGKSPLDLLAEAATGHFKHDMLPKKLYDELQSKGADPHGPLFEEYSISSFTEPFVILSEKRETTLLAEMLKAQNIDNYLAFIQSEIERDPSLNAKIADALLTPNASGSTVLGDLFQKSESNQAAINFALQCVDKKDKRFANVVCDEIPIDSPYLDLGNEDFLKKWLKQGLNINHQGEKTGNTLLHKRFQQGDSYDVATLLRQGANPKIKNHDGDTARASKPNHSISVPVVMNYAVRYAAKSVANGAKRVWKGIRGNRADVPEIIKESTRSIPSVVDKLENDALNVEKSAKRRGVRFADDSVEETAEKKPLEQRAEVKEVRTYQKGDEQGLSSEALDKATALLKEQPKKSILKKPKQESDAVEILTLQVPQSTWKTAKPSELKSPTSLSSHQPITPMSNGHKKHKVADMVQPIAKLSPTAAAAEVCVQEFQQALKELQAGKLPDFCQADVPLRVARQACIDILKKIDDLEKTNKLAPSDIRVIAFEVGAGRVLKKENPLSELRTKIEAIESTSKSKLKPGGNPASSA